MMKLEKRELDIFRELFSGVGRLNGDWIMDKYGPYNIKTFNANHIKIYNTDTIRARLLYILVLHDKLHTFLKIRSIFLQKYSYFENNKTHTNNLNQTCNNIQVSFYWRTLDDKNSWSKDHLSTIANISEWCSRFKDVINDRKKFENYIKTIK